MKHKIADDVEINLNVDLTDAELPELVDRVVEGAVIIIAVSTAAHICKSLFKK